MRDLGDVAEDGKGVGAVGILAAQFGQGACGVSGHDHLEQVEDAAPVGEAEHCADLIGGGFAGAVADCLIEERLRVACRPFGGAGDEGEGFVGDLSAFGIRDATQHCDHHFGFDPAKVEALAAREHGDGHLADLGRGEDEFHMRGRLFERLEERVEGARRQHVNFVDNVDLVARRRCAIGHRVNDFADVADARAAGGVHLEHVDVAALRDRHAMLALTAGISGRATLAVRPDAVHPLGDDPRGGGFPRASDARHDEGLRDAVGLERVPERPDHRVLSDEVGKGLGAVFPREDLIACVGGVAHGPPWWIRGSGETRPAGRGRPPLRRRDSPRSGP